MSNLFTKHPTDINETYWQHMCFAAKYGAHLIGAGLACIIHGIFPFLFMRTASQTIENLQKKCQNRNNNKHESIGSQNVRK